MAAGSHGSPPWWALVAILLVVTTLPYLPTLRNGFTNWDDPRYVIENPEIDALNAGTIGNLFTRYFVGNYHPITMLSYAIDVQIGGKKPFVFHTTNLLLHLISTVLVFVFARSLLQRGDLACVVALLFAIHPMHVEPVAWVAGRKELLLAAFFLGGLITHVAWVKRGGRGAGLYMLTLLLFLCAILSKAVAVVFPVILVLLDFLLARSRSSRLITEKIPFFAASALFGCVAIAAQKSAEAIGKPEIFSLYERAALASHAVLRYLKMLTVPMGLSCFYPYPVEPGRPFSPAVLVGPLLVAILLAAVFYSLRFTRWIAFGAGFFLVLFAPVLQFLSVGSAIIADRYSYLPFVGAFLAVAAALGRIGDRSPAACRAVTLGAALVVLVFALATWARCGVWHDSGRLWTDAISKYPNAAQPYSSRARWFIDQRDFDRAMADLDRSIALGCGYADPYVNRGNIHGLRKELGPAIADFTKGIEVEPGSFDAYYNRGITYRLMKRLDLAEEDLDRALAIRPQEARAHFLRAQVLLEAGKLDGSIRGFTEGLRFAPEDADALVGRGVAYHNSRSYEAAIADFSRAAEQRPDRARIYLNRAHAYDMVGKTALALQDAERAASLGEKVDPAFLERLRSGATK